MGKGPLFCLADLMEDLAEEGRDREEPLSAVSSTPHDQQSSVSIAGSFPTTENLEEAFERAYMELDLALKTSGHSWTRLTQELYTALTLASQVVTKVNSNLKVLAGRIIGLKSVLERSDSVTANLTDVLQSIGE